MRASLLRACLRPVLGPSLLLPAAAALLLPLLTLPALDGHHALDVLRGVGVLLACAWLASVDDPSGEVLAASPYPFGARTGSRVLVGAVVVLPVWAGAATVVHWRNPWLPVAAVGLEALALGLLGLAAATGLRAWREQSRPALPAALGLLAFVGVLQGAPRWYAVHQSQTWGPPWEAAHLRWLALALLGLAVLTAALRDPAARHRA